MKGRRVGSFFSFIPPPPGWPPLILLIICCISLTPSEDGRVCGGGVDLNYQGPLESYSLKLFDKISTLDFGWLLLC